MIVDKFVVKLPMKAAGMVVIKSFWLRTGTPWSLSCMSLTSCSSLSKTAGRWEMPLDEDDAPEDEAPPEGGARLFPPPPPEETAVGKSREADGSGEEVADVEAARPGPPTADGVAAGPAGMRDDEVTRFATIDCAAAALVTGGMTAAAGSIPAAAAPLPGGALLRTAVAVGAEVDEGLVVLLLLLLTCLDRPSILRWKN